MYLRNETLKRWLKLLNTSGINSKKLVADEIAALFKDSLPKEEIIEAYSNYKMSAVELAEKYGVSRTTIINRLHEWGVELHWKKSYLPKEEVIADYQCGFLTMTEIAQKYKTSTRAISERLHEWNIPIIRTHRRKRRCGL